MPLYDMDDDEEVCECDVPQYAWNEEGEYRCLRCNGLQGGEVYPDDEPDEAICEVCYGTGAGRYGGKCRHCHGEGIR